MYRGSVAWTFNRLLRRQAVLATRVEDAQPGSRLSAGEEERLIELPGLVLTGEEAEAEEVESLHLNARSWALLWGSAIAVLGALVAAAFLAAS